MNKTFWNSQLWYQNFKKHSEILKEHELMPYLDGRMRISEMDPRMNQLESLSTQFDFLLSEMFAKEMVRA
jgi:hypothetical protein